MSHNYESLNLPGDDEKSLFASIEAVLNRSNRIDDDHRKAQEYERIANELVPNEERIDFAQMCIDDLNANCEYLGKPVIVTGDDIEERYLKPNDDGTSSYTPRQMLTNLNQETLTSKGYIFYFEEQRDNELQIIFRHLTIGNPELVAETRSAGEIYSRSHFPLPIDGSVKVFASEPTNEVYTDSLESFTPELLFEINEIIEETKENDDQFLSALAYIDFSKHEQLFNDPYLVKELTEYINLKHSVTGGVEVILSNADTLIIPNENDNVCTPHAVSGSDLTVLIDKIEFTPPLDDQTQPKLSLSAYVVIRDERGKSVKKRAYIPLTPDISQRSLPSYDANN
jgi:hypothetical protein